MPVYVDDYYKCPASRFGRMRMSHMFADSLDELHDMAANLGLRPDWFQFKFPSGCPHYDLSKSKRDEAFRIGAVPLPIGDTMEEKMNWRNVYRRCKENCLAQIRSEMTNEEEDEFQ